MVSVLLAGTTAASSLDQKRPSKKVGHIVQYMLKKMGHTIKLLEDSKEIPICMLIKQEQKRKSNMTSYELFNFNMQLLKGALKFARANSPRDPILLHVARDVHIGRRLARKIGPPVAVKMRSNGLMKIHCVLMTTRLSGGERILLRDYMLRVYDDLFLTARAL